MRPHNEAVRDRHMPKARRDGKRTPFSASSSPEAQNHARGPRRSHVRARGRRQSAAGVSSMNSLDSRSHIGDQTHAIAGVCAGQQPDLLVRFGSTRVALCGLRRVAGVSLASNMRRDNVRGRGLRRRRGNTHRRKEQKNRQPKYPHRRLHRPGASLACSRGYRRDNSGARRRVGEATRILRRFASISGAMPAAMTAAPSAFGCSLSLCISAGWP